MPLYTFESKDGRIEDMFYTMAEVPRLGDEVTIDGIVWKRVFTKPNAAISTQSNPYSAKDFNRNLDGKKVTVGDMWDASKEASEKRAAKEGTDPIKQAYYDKYAKDRRGVIRHVNEKKEIFEKQGKETLKEMKKVVENLSQI